MDMESCTTIETQSPSDHPSLHQLLPFGIQHLNSNFESPASIHSYDQPMIPQHVSTCEKQHFSASRLPPHSSHSGQLTSRFGIKVNNTKLHRYGVETKYTSEAITFYLPVFKRRLSSDQRDFFLAFEKLKNNEIASLKSMQVDGLETNESEERIHVYLPYFQRMLSPQQRKFFEAFHTMKNNEIESLKMANCLPMSNSSSDANRLISPGENYEENPRPSVEQREEDFVGPVLEEGEERQEVEIKDKALDGDEAASTQYSRTDAFPMEQQLHRSASNFVLEDGRCDLKNCGWMIESGDGAVDHWIKCHYNVLFAYLGAPDWFVSKLEHWKLTQLGSKKKRETKSILARNHRRCLHCYHLSEYKGRKGLLNHIKEMHPEIFRKLQMQYRNICQTTNMSDIDCNENIHSILMSDEIYRSNDEESENEEKRKGQVQEKIEESNHEGRVENLSDDDEEEEEEEGEENEEEEEEKEEKGEEDGSCGKDKEDDEKNDNAEKESNASSPTSDSDSDSDSSSDSGSDSDSDSDSNEDQEDELPSAPKRQRVQTENACNLS